MTRTLSALFAFIALLGGPLAGQGKPVFAGTWKLSEPATAEMFTPTVMTVAQDATALIVTTTSQMGEFKTSYKLDGSEVDMPMGQMTAKVSAKWDGGKLVITTKSERGEQTQTWSLADGKLKIDRTGGRGPSSMTYKKTT